MKFFNKKLYSFINLFKKGKEKLYDLYKYKEIVFHVVISLIIFLLLIILMSILDGFIYKVRTGIDVYNFFKIYTAGIAAYIALIQINKNRLIHKRNKRADAIFHCNNRYDQIRKEYFESKKQIQYQGNNNYSDDIKNKEIEFIKNSYYSKYFGLKSDEFDFWLSGFIDIDTFYNWIILALNKLRESNKNNEDSDFNYLKGWTETGEKDNWIPNPWFTEFMATLVFLVNFMNDDNIKNDTKNFNDQYDKIIGDITLELLIYIDENSKSYKIDVENEFTAKSYKKHRDTFQHLTPIDAMFKLLTREKGEYSWETYFNKQAINEYFKKKEEEKVLVKIKDKDNEKYKLIRNVA